VHKPVSSSKNALEEKLSELEDHQLKALRKTEITQLKKRFPKRVDVDEKSYRFIFKSSDPDWVRKGNFTFSLYLKKQGAVYGTENNIETYDNVGFTCF